MSILARLRNLVFCDAWSFRTTACEISPPVLRPGDEALVTGAILNDGLRLGTVYLVMLIANPYDHEELILDTHRDLPDEQKRSLRIVDIPRGEQVRFSMSWSVPTGAAPGVYDVSLQLWNPAKLFRSVSPFFRFHYHCFHQTPWRGVIEVVGYAHGATEVGANATSREGVAPRVFISYSWDSPAHQKWVLDLADELIRHGIDVIVDKRNLYPGEEITEFIERGIRECDVFLMVCSDRYTEKAKGRIGGVGLETVISSATFLHARKTKKFIPAVRNNTKPAASKLPAYLGSTLYVDMESDSWRAEPFQELLRAINRKIRH